jgi:hypothetical protein
MQTLNHIIHPYVSIENGWCVYPSSRWLQQINTVIQQTIQNSRTCQIKKVKQQKEERMRKKQLTMDLI